MFGGGCVTRAGGPAYPFVLASAEVGLATTSGGGLASLTETNIPGQVLPITPVLQAQDGTFVGTVSTGQGQTNMIGFDNSGNVKWSVPNDYPEIATADGGVIGASGITYDSNGNATGQLGPLPTYSWVGYAYQYGSVDQVSHTPPMPASSFWAAIGGNHYGTAMPTLGTQLDIQDDNSAWVVLGNYEAGVLYPPCAKIGQILLPNLPPNAQTCSIEGFEFSAPPGYNLREIVAAGKAGGKWNPNSWARAVGQCGTYDYQRMIVSPGKYNWIQGYVNVGNIGVGAYLEGAGWSRDWAHVIANVVYAHLKRTKNAGPITGAIDPSYFTYLGWDFANEGSNPTCN
jgi:hypothetical protein